ncbi:hypothetical protein ACFQPA_20800 [Halomarina halobia]|uniref:Uncharacterized protein n=1 Tax=Halomarina halobia TaxID=3033386 RepID=A0ABD6AEN4_9EURY|nr:hypothetical protein [Halomarina sp. PSR21]
MAQPCLGEHDDVDVDHVLDRASHEAVVRVHVVVTAGDIDRGRRTRVRVQDYVDPAAFGERELCIDLLVRPA